jgi:hypothetical protein
MPNSGTFPKTPVFLKEEFLSRLDKAMVALIADCAAGRVAHGTEALFVHTGGSPALFHYRGHLAVPRTL